MKQTFKTRGVCAPRIEFEVDDNSCIHNVQFMGGCAGNTNGIAKLVEGMKTDEVITKLQGIQCRGGTSCPDQLAKALKNLANKPE